MENNYCTNCGELIANENSKVCTNCGKPHWLSQTETGRENGCSAEKMICVKEKSTFIAVTLSFFFAGFGQVYNGRLKKGLLMMLGYWIGIIFMGIPSLIIWIYSMYNANDEANKMNTGELPFVESTGKDAIIYLAAYLILMIVFLVATYIALILLIMLPYMVY